MSRALMRPGFMPVLPGHEGHRIHQHSHDGLGCSGRYYCWTCSDSGFNSLSARPVHCWLDGPPCNGELMELPPLGPVREAALAAFAAAAAEAPGQEEE